MKIKVHSNMTIYGVFQPPIDLELKQRDATLKDLLVELAIICKNIEFIKDNGLGTDVEKVLINDMENLNLDISLREGDEVKVIIEMAPLGGG